MQRQVLNMHDIILTSHWASHGAIGAHANGAVWLYRAAIVAQCVRSH